LSLATSGAFFAIHLRAASLEHFRFFQIAKALYLFIFPQLQTQNRYALLLALL
jgi:hypothetical protein